MKVKIGEVLKLKEQDAWNFITGAELLESITSMYVDSYFESDRLRIVNYVKDIVSDNRRRTLEVVFFDGIPTLVYQIVGHTKSCNIAVINEEKKDELSQLIINEYIKTSNERDGVDYKIITLESEFELDTYGAECEIYNGQLIAKGKS